jgi:hypothetical protein
VITSSNNRIRVTVTASFAPIVPIVPISASTIIYSSARTFVGLITLE